MSLHSLKKQTTFIFVFSTLVFWEIGCGTGDLDDALIVDSGALSGDGYTDADSDTDGDVDGDTDSDIDGDADGDTDTDSDADADTDSDADVDADSDADADSDTDADSDADADSDTDTDSDADMDSDTDTDVDDGSCPAPATCQAHCRSIGGTIIRDASCPEADDKCCDMTGADGDTDSDVDADADGDTDTDADGDADTDADGDTDTDADGDTDTDVDSDADSDTDADCVPEDPPEQYAEDIELTWKEMTGGFEGGAGARPVSASVLNFKNLIWDQVMATGGTLNYCIRWESSGTLSMDDVVEIEDALNHWADDWFSPLQGYNCWPYGSIDITVVGVAVSERSKATWDDDELPVYVGDYFENAPQCPQACGRFFHQDGSYAGCTGGDDAHYDMSLWLTDGFSGGVGGDWGQRMAPQTFMGNMGGDSNTIWQHEFGHGLGFPDYYNWTEWTGKAAPACIMNAGAAFGVTDWDIAMAKYTWDHLKSRLI